MTPAPPNANRHDWLLWQLVDSAFPTGGFAHSAGIEAAWQHGEIPSRAALASFIEASLRQLGHASLPFVTAAHRDPNQVAELDQLCDACASNHVANRASRLQGRALLNSAQRIFGLAPVDAPCGHFAPVFGTVTRALEIQRDTAVHLFFFNHLRSLTASAVRLNIVGPLEAQTLQHQFALTALDVIRACIDLDTEDVAQTAPLLELWQGAQDRLYSRLFQT